jgi:hypothetical protein
MSVTTFVFVVRPPERHVLTAERVIRVHKENTSEIIWLSIIKVGLINLVFRGENIILNVKQLHHFVSKNVISGFYIDNYFNKENVLLISYLNYLPLYVVNYGVYHCKDEYNYTFAKYFKVNLSLIILTRLKLLMRDFYLFYFTRKKLNIRRYIYKTSTIVFWNDYSRLNFIRDYPYAKTTLIQIKDINTGQQVSKKILVAPSNLGGRRGIAGFEELKLWVSHLVKIRKIFYDSSIHLSLHPGYNGAYLKELIELEWLTVFTGIPSEKVKEYSCVFTDTSTLFWVAESYGIQAYLLDGYKIPKEYFDPEKMGKAQYFSFYLIMLLFHFGTGNSQLRIIFMQ